MSRLNYSYPHWSLVQYADKILVLELIWPFPLILMGVLRILEPARIGVGIGLALLPWLARWLVLGRSSHPSFIGRPLALLGLSGLVGVWVSYDPTLSWPLLLTLYGSVSFFFAVVNTDLLPRRVGGVLVLAAGLVAFYFIGQYGHFYYPDESGLLPHLGRLTGSFLPDLAIVTLHPNAIASFLASVWLLSLVLAWQARGGERVAGWLMVLMVSYGLLISESRGAWLGLTAATGIWVWLSIPRRDLRLVLGGVGLLGGALCLLGFASINPTETQIPLLSSTVETGYSRLTLYRNSLNLWGDYLFTGIGLGDTFALIYSRYQLLIPYLFLSYAHNMFLAVGLGLGLLGLLAFLWLLFSFYQFVLKVETKGNFDPRSLSLFRAAWLGTTATFIHGLTDAPQWAGSGWTMPMLFAMLGLTVAVGRPALLQQAEANRLVGAGLVSLPRWVSRLKFGVVTILVIILAIFWRPLLSTWYANMGAIYQTRADLSPTLDDSAREATKKLAVDNFNHALYLNPGQSAAHWRLGLIALEQADFEAAVNHLEPVHRQMPANQAILKALGFAYLWSDRLDAAEELLRQRDDRGEVVEELEYWSWWLGTQNRADLSASAAEMARRLATE